MFFVTTKLQGKGWMAGLLPPQPPRSVNVNTTTEVVNYHHGHSVCDHCPKCHTTTVSHGHHCHCSHGFPLSTPLSPLSSPLVMHTSTDPAKKRGARCLDVGELVASPVDDIVLIGWCPTTDSYWCAVENLNESPILVFCYCLGASPKIMEGSGKWGNMPRILCN